MRTLFKKEKGQSMVETALVLPFLILILIGIMDFGWLFFNKLTVANCARESARYVSSYYCSVSGTDEEKQVAIMEAIKTRVEESNSTLEEDHTEWSYEVNGNYITITVRSDVRPLTGMFAVFFGDDGRCSMESSVTMYIEQY